jgi:hypothetical protein
MCIEPRWLGVRKTCGMGLFYRDYRSLLEETGWLGAGFIYVCLKTRFGWVKPRGFYLPDCYCRTHLRKVAVVEGDETARQHYYDATT